MLDKVKIALGPIPGLASELRNLHRLEFLDFKNTASSIENKELVLFQVSLGQLRGSLMRCCELFERFYSPLNDMASCINSGSNRAEFVTGLRMISTKAKLYQRDTKTMWQYFKELNEVDFDEGRIVEVEHFCTLVNELIIRIEESIENLDSPLDVIDEVALQEQLRCAKNEWSELATEANLLDIQLLEETA